MRQLQLYCPLYGGKCSQFEEGLITTEHSDVKDCAPLRIEVKHMERPLGEHPESQLRLLGAFRGGQADVIGRLGVGATTHL